jgi:hypothetical protein
MRKDSMGKKLKAISEFASWEEEDDFWAAHSLSDLDLEQDPTPLIIEPKALRHVKKVDVLNPLAVRSWKRKTA